MSLDWPEEKAGSSEMCRNAHRTTHMMTLLHLCPCVLQGGYCYFRFRFSAFIAIDTGLVAAQAGMDTIGSNSSTPCGDLPFNPVSCQLSLHKVDDFNATLSWHPFFPPWWLYYCLNVFCGCWCSFYKLSTTNSMIRQATPDYNVIRCFSVTAVHSGSRSSLTRWT